jgi:D-amino-acid dehydrogenase
VKVAVVGGGVVGLACAFELRRAGAEVVVLERGSVGGGTSLGNTGWVCPSFSYPLPGPGVIGDGLRSVLHPSSPLAVRAGLDPGYLRWLWRFRAHCTSERWRDGVRALARLNTRTVELLDDYLSAGVGFESHGAGLLIAARSPARLAAYRELLTELRGLGAAVYRELAAGAAAEAEPSLDPGLAGALLTEVDRWVRPESLTAGLAEWLRADGAEVREGVEVREVSGTRVTTDREEIAFDRVVVAAGMASAPFLRRLGVRVTLAPARGYSLLYAPGSAPAPRHALYLADARLGVSRYQDGVRIAGVFELGHDGIAISERRLAAMLASADPFFSAWQPSQARAASRWSGLRPLTSDGLPLIGPTPRDPGVFVATGHGMLGVTLAPATAALLATLVLEGRLDPALSAFLPSRAA